MPRTTFPRHLLSLAVVTAVAVAWALFIFAKGDALPKLGGGDEYKVSVVTPTGAAMAVGSRVTVAGVKVGRVTSVSRLGIGAKMELLITDPDVAPLPRDSRVQVRQHTPVGENYVAIKVGRSRETIADGGGLSVQQTDEFVDVDRLLSVLKGGTRERARDTIRSLGAAVGTEGEELNGTVGGATKFLKAAGDPGGLVDVLRRNRDQTARLVQQLGDVTASIGQRDQAITTLADRGLTALTALRRSDRALEATIDELPDTLRDVQRTSGVVRSTSGVATPVVDEASKALVALRPTVARLPAATADGRALMRELSPAAPVLERTLQQVDALSGPLAESLPKLRKTICELTPVTRYAEPYFPEVLSIVQGLGSSSNSYDATGHLIRLAPIVTPDNFPSGLPDVISKGLADFVHRIPGMALNFDPYPKPGSVGRTRAKGTTPLGPEEVPKSGYTYPRITADC